MSIIANIKLDFAKTTFPVTVFAKQFDYNSRQIVITPLNKGMDYELPADVIAKIQLTKPDGKTVIGDCNIKNNQIIVDMTAQMLTVSGKGTAEIGLYKKDYCLSTQTFFIDVEKSAYDENALQSSDEFGFINDALGKAESALLKADTAEGIVNGLDERTDEIEKFISSVKTGVYDDATIIKATVSIENGFSEIMPESLLKFQDGKTYRVLLIPDKEIVFDGMTKWLGGGLQPYTYFDGTDWVDTTNLTNCKYDAGQVILLEVQYIPINYKWFYQRILNPPTATISSGGGDGFSPTAKVEQTEDGALITITDKNGTTTATVKNGVGGSSVDVFVAEKGLSESFPNLTFLMPEKIKDDKEHILAIIPNADIDFDGNKQWRLNSVLLTVYDGSFWRLTDVFSNRKFEKGQAIIVSVKYNTDTSSWEYMRILNPPDSATSIVGTSNIEIFSGFYPDGTNLPEISFTPSENIKDGDEHIFIVIPNFEVVFDGEKEWMLNFKPITVLWDDGEPTDDSDWFETYVLYDCKIEEGRAMLISGKYDTEGNHWEYFRFLNPPQTIDTAKIAKEAASLIDTNLLTAIGNGVLE
jgi:hypothetical protein